MNVHIHHDIIDALPYIVQAQNIIIKPERSETTTLDFNPDHNPTVVGYEQAMNYQIRNKEAQKHMGYDSPSIIFEAKLGDNYVPISAFNESKSQHLTLPEAFEMLMHDMMVGSFTPKRILRHDPATIVFWGDGTKTVVKRAPDEPDNAYAAFTAALAIKLFSSNSALKKIVERKMEEQK